MNTQQIYEFFKKAVLKKRMCHSLIIYGGSEETRKNIAINAAKILECETSPDVCQNCYSCKTIPDGNFPDVHFVQPEKRNLSIDEVRSIKEQIYTKPYTGRYRIFIIETDWMQQPAANSILKIMEEPPAYGIIIILTKNNKNFLPTIVSRAINLKINPDIDMVFDSKELTEKILSLLKAAKEKKWQSFFEITGEISKELSREEIENLFEGIVILGRKSLLYATGIEQSGLPEKQFLDIIKIDRHSLIEEILEKRLYLRFNVNTRIFLETLALQITEPKWRNWQTR